MANLQFDVVALDRASRTFLAMASQIERFSARLDKLDGQTARVTLSADDRDLDRKLAEGERKRKNLDGKSATVNVNARIDKSFADATITVERMFSALGTFALPVGVAAAIPVTVALAGAAVQAGGALGLIPAAGFAGAAAMGAFAVGTAGAGDALKALGEGDLEKFNEEVAKMAPNMAGTMRSVQALWPALSALRLDVQQQLWAGLGAQVTALGTIYLPRVRGLLAGTATDLNAVAVGIGTYLASAQGVSTVDAIFANTRATMSELRPVGADIVAILLDIAAVGSEFLPGLVGGFADATTAAREWVAEARNSGQLFEIISNGLSILGNLALALIDIGAISANIFRAAGVDADGFTNRLSRITQMIREWTASMEGQAAIAQFFASLRDIASALLPILGAVALSIVNVINTLGPTLPGLSQGLLDVMTAAEPLMTVFTQMAVVVLSALGPALSFLAPVLGPLVAAFVAARVATAAWAVAQGIASAATVAYNVAIGIAQVAQLAYAVATSAGTARLVAWAAAQWLVNAAMSANPIGLVVVALAALVAGLALAWNHSETFRAVVTAAWDGIRTAAGVAWDYLSGVFAAIPGVLASVGGFFTGLWQSYVVPAWNGIVATVQAAWAGIQAAGTTAYGVLQTIFTAIGAAVTAVGAFFMALYTNYVQPAFNAIVEAGRLLVTILATVVLAPIVIALNLAQLAFNSLRDFAVAAFRVISEEASIWWSFLQGIWNAVVGYVSGQLGPVFTTLQAIVVAVWRVISAEISAWWTYVSSIWNAVVAYLQGAWTAAYNTARDMVINAFRAVSDFIATWWAIVQAIWQVAISFLSGAFSNAHTAFRDLLISIWNALAQRVSNWWNAEVLPIWNAIIAFLAGAFTNAYNAFRNAVVAVWNALSAMLISWWNATIQPLWNSIVAYVIGPFVAGFNTMRNGVIAAWNALRDGIVAVWTAIRSSVFDPIVNFVTVTIPNAFNQGVAAIRRAWDGVKAAMRDPIQAAINVVYNNGVVWVFNKVAETVGLSTRLSTYNLPGFETGGPITGGTPGKDSVLIKAMPGEYVFSKPAVDRAGGPGAIESLHRALTGRASYGPEGARMWDDAPSFGDLPGFQGGGLIGGAVSAVGGFLSDVWDRATGFVNTLAGQVGGSPWAQLAVGLGRKTIDMVVTWGKKKIEDWLASFAQMGGGLGGGTMATGTGQVAEMMRILRVPFPGLGLISGFRPGAITATGNRSYHSMGRAVDIPPRMDVFNWIRANYGARTRELIFSPANGAQIWNGRPHMYTGITRANHWDHVHWAYGNGGVIDRPTFGLLGESGPEVVLPIRRPDRAAQLAERAGVGGREFHVHVTTSPTASAEQLVRTAMHEARLDRLAGRYARGRG